MLKTRLRQLCDQIQKEGRCPGNTVLFAAQDGCPDLFRELSALANSPGGGVLLFGMELPEEGKPVLCGVYDGEDLKEKLGWQCAEMAPTLYPLYTKATVDGKEVLAAEIPEIDKRYKPCYHQAVGRTHGAFKWVDGRSQRMTEAEIHNYEAYENRARDELRVCEQAQWEDIHQENVETYIRRLVGLNRLQADMDREQMLRMEGLQTGGKPTLAAVLLFGYDPQSFYPQFSIMASLYSQGEARECRRINGTLDMLCEQALQFVRKSLLAAGTAGGREQLEHLTDAIREALLNALIHRDYSKYAEDKPVYLWIFDEYIQVCSPGGFFGAPDAQCPPKGLRSLRNPKIMDILETLGALPQENSGLQYMGKMMEKAGLASPEIKAVDDWFSVIFQLPARKYEDPAEEQLAEMSDMERQVWDYCSQPRTLAELAARFSWKSPYYMRTKLLMEMIDKEMLEVVDLHGKQKVHYQAI